MLANQLIQLLYILIFIDKIPTLAAGRVVLNPSSILGLV
jgi:hypothetical protein